MDLVGAADRFCRSLGETDVANLASLDQAGHGADGLLDRNLRIDPMQVVEIDDIDAEALEARVARPPGVVRRAVNAARRATRVAQYAELGREHNRVAPLADDATHQFLVVPSPVGVRGIEKGDAEFKGAKQRQARLVIVG